MRTLSNIVLCGFMGAGKTSIAVELEDRYGFKAIDTDLLIEKETGCTISQIFEKEGEAKFRDYERCAVERAAALDGAAVSTGGGSVMAADNLRLLQQRGMLFFLSVPFDELFRRICRDRTRPLAAGLGKEALAELFSQREPVYKSLDVIVEWRGRGPASLAEEVFCRFRSSGGIAPPPCP